MSLQLLAFLCLFLKNNFRHNWLILVLFFAFINIPLFPFLGVFLSLNELVISYFAKASLFNDILCAAFIAFFLFFEHKRYFLSLFSLRALLFITLSYGAFFASALNLFGQMDLNIYFISPRWALFIVFIFICAIFVLNRFLAFLYLITFVIYSFCNLLGSFSGNIFDFFVDFILFLIFCALVILKFFKKSSL